MYSGSYKKRQDAKSFTNNSLKRPPTYVDALIHDETALAPLVGLYALINKMRVVSDPRIAERADKFVRMIVDTYTLPNKTLPELRHMLESGALDPLRDFSEMCREESSALTPSHFSSHFFTRSGAITDSQRS
jgi:hypothetical protein